MAFLNGTDPGLRQTRTPTVDTFAAGVGFTAGSSTYVTLSVDCGTEASLITTFDGITQHRDTYSYDTSNRRVTFDAAIPTGVSKIECTYTTTIPATTPADGSVGTAQLADLAVSGAKLANNSVAGTKIALGSDAQGDIMYYNGTDYARLAKGTASQQLRMNSGATAPEWATITASQDYVKLGTTTASNSATVGITGFDNSTYKDYIIRFRSIVPDTDGGVIFHARTSTDGGSSYESGAGNYTWINARGHHSGSGIHTANSSSDSEIEVTAGSLGSDTAESLSGWMEVLNTGDSTNYSHMQGLLVLSDHNATSSTQFWFSASRQSAADIDAVQFYFASGNVESGDFVLYGIK